jgi:non-specific serine/threonine protein kinase
LERLVEGLQDRRLLLVLDNCEHLLDSCAQVVDAILSSCPEVKIMITSRETLDIDGERVWLVPPLTAPAGADLAAVGGLDAFESVELFLDRAQAVRSGRELSDSEVSAIARACGRLDGIPLALELAAGQMLAMSAQEILDRLDSRFALLEAGSRSRLPRHQTMRRAVDWSHNLLSDQEKVLFRRLSVFAGGFDLQAVGPVCGWDPLMADEVSGLIGNLVRKSLVLVDEGPAGRSRYRLLETLRQYAAEKLDAAAEADPTRRLHAITYSALAEPLEQVRRTPQGPGFLQYLAAEYDNACAALEWSDAHDGELFLDLTANWARYWSDRGLMSEGRRWLEKGLVRPGGPVQRRGLMIMMLAQILYRMDAAEISEVVETGLSLLEGTDDRYLQAGLINLAGMAYVQAGRWEDAKARFIEATKLGDGEPLFGPALANLGECDWVLGDATTGRSRINRAITMYRDGGLSHLIAPGLILLGHLERVEGRVPAAQEALMEALELCQNMGDQHYLAEAFRALAFAAAADLQPEASLRLRGLARSINRHVGAVDGTWAFGQQGEQLVEDMRATVGEARAAELAKEGAAMSVEDAIEYARCLTQAYSSGDEATERSSY